MTFYGPHPQYTQVFLQEDAERCLEEARALKLKATVVLIQKRVSSRTTHKLLHVLGYIVYCTPYVQTFNPFRWEDSWLEPGTRRCIELHYAYSTLWKAILQGDNSIRPGILKTGQFVTKLTLAFCNFFYIPFLDSGTRSYVVEWSSYKLSFECGGRGQSI